MNTLTKVAAFLVGLAGVFAVTYGVGNAVGPIGASAETHDDTHGSSADESADAHGVHGSETAQTRPLRPVPPTSRVA